MGGLWEAAVKSFKYHFKRVAVGQKFSFEEFATILARIEGVLNSRPISALSEDPSDLTALTPGHFLRGAPLMAFPEQDLSKLSLINRWEKLKVIHHQFALRWKNDYLKSLHKRYKWRQSVTNMQIGDLVVVMDDLLPPHEWRLGRIEKTFSGSDGNVRTAEVRTANGIMTRPIVKLCLLPFMNQEEVSPSNRRLTATRVPSESRDPHRSGSQVPRDLEVYYCVLCKGYHGLKYCKRFLKMTPQRRQDVVERLSYCINCLARSHNSRSCTSRETCKKCNKWHHTLLHQPRQTRTNDLRATSSSPRRHHQTSQRQQPRRPQQQQSRRQQHQTHRHHQHRRQHQQHRHHRQQQYSHHRQQQYNHHRQKHQLIQQPLAPVTAPPKITPTSTPPTPNQHILAEAIKSLANVLCYQSKAE